MNSYQVIFNQQALSIGPGQSLLDVALNQNLNIANSCRSGVCQSCLVHIEEGEPPPGSQRGLSENQIKQNLALACQLKPTAPLTLSSTTSTKKFTTRVLASNKLNNSVLRLRLATPFDWFPGQFITLWKNQSVGRPYSLASLPNEQFLELHIKHHQHGELSSWLHTELEVGQEIEISGSKGHCFYSQSMQEKPILLAGIGTGLAPLYGILRDALNQNHTQPIILYIAFKNTEESYLYKELAELQYQHHNFSFHPILRDDNKAGYETGDIVEIVKQQHQKLQNWCIFLCGAPSPIQKLQRLCFLRGASMSDIYVDPFTSPQPTPRS